MPRNKEQYAKWMKRAASEFKKKYPTGGCTTTTTPIKCDRRYHERTFGLGVPLWPEDAPKNLWVGTPKHLYDIRTFGAGSVAKDSHPWVPEGTDNKYKNHRALPWHPTKPGKRYTPEETRQRVIWAAVWRDPDLTNDIAKWEKGIKCEVTKGKPPCRGPYAKEGPLRDGGRDVIDVSSYASWETAKKTWWAVGVCIRKKFRCLPTGTITKKEKPKKEPEKRRKGTHGPPPNRMWAERRHGPQDPMDSRDRRSNPQAWLHNPHFDE